MGTGGLQGVMARARTTAIGLVAALALAACAPTTYAGIPLRAGAADPELQQLARRAQARDKLAQLELGIRYEEGRGVQRDLGKAEHLYRLAAADAASRTWIYSPPVRAGEGGRAIPVPRAPEQAGLQEAVRRLSGLRNRRAGQ